MKLNIQGSAAAAVLTSTSATITALAVIAESVFELENLYGIDGQEGLDIQVIQEELETRFSCIIPQAVRNKLQALIMLRGTEFFENDVTAFCGFTLACVDGHLGDLVAGSLEEPSLQEAAWAIFEAACVDPESDGLSPSVETFVLGLQDEDDESFIAAKLEAWTEQLRTLKVPEDLIGVLMERGSNALKDAQNTE